jgi:hypothetical protein
LILGFFSILFLAFLIEYIVYKKELNALDEQKATIVKENKLPSTMYQIKSIKKSLNKKFTTQKAIREKLYNISKIDLQDGEYIEKFELSTNDIYMVIHIDDATRGEAIKSSIKKLAKIKSSNFDKNSLSIRIGL